MDRNFRIKEDGRECDKCKTFKLWEEFSKNRTNKTGYQTRCKICSFANGRKYVKREVRDVKHEAGFSMKIQQFCLGFKQMGEG